MSDWPDQPEYPEGDLPRPSAAQLWRMWRSERERADFLETIGRQWMEAWKDVRAERDHAVAALSEQIATLIRERDEAIKERNGARRTICRMESEKRYDQARRDLPGKKIIAVKPEMVAQEFGWFCFCKEEP